MMFKASSVRLVDAASPIRNKTLSHEIDWINHGNPISNVVVSVQLATKWACLKRKCDFSDSLGLPMHRNLPQPLDAGISHRNVVVKSLGDGASDEGRALLLQQLDQPLLLRNQPIDLRRLTVEEGGDSNFFASRRFDNCKRFQSFFRKLHKRAALPV